MTEIKYVETLGFKVFSDNLNRIPLKDTNCKVINTISPNSYSITTKDAAFKHALTTCDYLVLDGVYFALASLLLHGKNIKRNQGPDLFNHFINRLGAAKGKAFFLGSSPQTLKKIEDRIAKEYPEIQGCFYSPPFKDEFTDEDNARMIKTVNEFEPDILFVGMTCPKQEKWAITNKDLIKPCLVICIGNVFDWFAGTQKVIHPFWFKLRLGWLVRIFYRPEVFKRNIGNQMKFFRNVILIFLHIIKYD